MGVNINIKYDIRAPRLMAQRQRQGFLASVTWVRALACMSVTPAVSYLPTGLARCSVGPGMISCGTRKLVRTPRITKFLYIYIFFNPGCPDQLTRTTTIYSNKTSYLKISLEMLKKKKKTTMPMCVRVEN
jgi:hypothetical protein